MDRESRYIVAIITNYGIIIDIIGLVFAESIPFLLFLCDIRVIKS